MNGILYFNPSCSKCRTAEALLTEKGLTARIVRYLDNAPTVDQLRDLMAKLQIDDPRLMTRTNEPVYSELGLHDADEDQLLEAMSENPILLERPIYVVGESAVIARPPERLLEIL